jgi:hypothetical protein
VELTCWPVALAFEAGGLLTLWDDDVDVDISPLGRNSLVPFDDAFSLEKVEKTSDTVDSIGPADVAFNPPMVVEMGVPVSMEAFSEADVVKAIVELTN